MTGTDLEPVDPDKYQRDKAKVEAGFWDKLRRSIGRVPFAEDAVASYYCAVDPQTPLQVKAILMGALAYFIVPADMIPDFIAMLGFTDDAAVIAAAIRTVLPHVGERHRIRARAALEGERLDEPAA
ncbi:MAG: DUF1232 domain-containing protein [Kiloniellales bacterium]|nr:DUF1232 domain-containing protein [Kiloniellales bacterium]